MLQLYCPTSSKARSHKSTLDNAQCCMCKSLKKVKHDELGIHYEGISAGPLRGCANNNAFFWLGLTTCTKRNLVGPFSITCTAQRNRKAQYHNGPICQNQGE